MSIRDLMHAISNRIGHQTDEAEIKPSRALTESRGMLRAWQKCGTDKWTAEGGSERPKGRVGSDGSSRYRAGMCWHPVKEALSWGNQGGTADSIILFVLDRSYFSVKDEFFVFQDSFDGYQVTGVFFITGTGGQDQ